MFVTVVGMNDSLGGARIATFVADPSAAGANVSRGAGLGYVGMLAGPAAIGWLTHLIALNHAFVLLILLCAITAVAAGILRTGSDRTPEPAHGTR